MVKFRINTEKYDKALNVFVNSKRFNTYKDSWFEEDSFISNRPAIKNPLKANEVFVLTNISLKNKKIAEMLELSIGRIHQIKFKGLLKLLYCQKNDKDKYQSYVMMLEYNLILQQANYIGE